MPFSLVFFMTLESPVAHHLVAVDVDLVHLDLVVLIDVDVDKHAVGVGEVVVERDHHIGVAEALVVEVFLYDELCAVYHILGDLLAGLELKALLQILALTLLGAVVGDLGDTRLLAQMDGEPRLVARDLVDLDAHLREEALVP